MINVYDGSSECHVYAYVFKSKMYEKNNNNKNSYTYTNEPKPMQNVWSNLSRILIRVIFLNYVQKNIMRCEKPSITLTRNQRLLYIYVCDVCVCVSTFLFWVSFTRILACAPWLLDSQTIIKFNMRLLLLLYASSFFRSFALLVRSFALTVCMRVCLYEINCVCFSVWRQHSVQIVFR